MFARNSVSGNALRSGSSNFTATRNMATLKEISMRLNSVKNIEKITKSMKMIASTKMTRAQKLMQSARAFGNASNSFFEHVEPEAATNPVVLGISSDRGLCGGIHSSISKSIKSYTRENADARLVPVGLKSRVQLQRGFKSNIALSFESVAKALPTWGESAMIADGINKSGLEFDGVRIVYNKFMSVISFETEHLQVPRLSLLEASSKLSSYEVDKPVLENFAEFAFANALYSSIAEGQASELAARRNAMENATKNAGEMIQKLTLTYNRQRQAVITNELCDIVTGASALD